MKSIIRTLMVLLTLLFACHVQADSVAYYFQYSNELIDLCYPGDTFYAGVALQCPEPNHLNLYMNPFSAPGEYDCMGNYVNSPLVAGPSFGVQVFALDSALISERDDFVNFMSKYNVVMPENWGVRFNGQVSEFGVFEFVNAGTGSTRQDPLLVNIFPKQGADLTGYEFNSVFAFVQPNAEGYYFAAHIAGFTTDPAFWGNGSLNPNSAYFAVGECEGGDMPLITPEPSLLIIISAGIITILVGKR